MRPPDDPVFRVLNEVGIIAQLSTTMFERVMPAGMTLAQFTVLNHFARLGGTRRPSDLARAFQVSRGTMTSTLGKLEAKGLVSIVDDAQDGRGRIVAMTEAGAAMREACIAALGPMLAALRENPGEGVFAQALPLLATIRQELDRSRDA